MQTDIKNIGKQRAKWIQAINNCSVEGFVNIITDDVVWFPPRNKAIEGKQNIHNWLEKPFTELDYDYSVSDVNIRIAGDWAIERAKFTSLVSAKSGENLPPHKGQYTLLWRKSKVGIWLIERYIDHSAEFIEIDSGSAT